MKDVTKKALAIGGIALGCLAIGGLAGANMFPVEKQVPVEVKVPVEVTKIVTETKEVPVEVVKEVPVEKIVTVEDNAFVQTLCDRLVYDDIVECKEEVVAEDKAIALAIQDIKDNFADKLEDFDVVSDENDVELVSIKSDFEDIKIVSSNFDKDEYTFEIKAKIDDDDSDMKKWVVFTVNVDDGESEIVDIEVA